MDLSNLFSNETLAIITPPLVSAVLTMFYAIEGWKSSKEDFNINKFATTMGTEIVTIFVVAGLCFGFDLTAYPEILMFAPTVMTILITKAISWYNKNYVFSSVTPPPEPVDTPPFSTLSPLPQTTAQVHTINIIISTKDPQQTVDIKKDEFNPNRNIP